MSNAPKKSFKVVVLGAVSVGKTSLSIQYVDSQFVAAKATIAAAFHTKGKCNTRLAHRTLQINGLRVDLQIWDTAGQEKFRSLTPMYYRDCAAALVVYDLSKPETLEAVEYWVKELREKENPYVIIVVGNKSDCVRDLTEAAAAGRAFAEANQLPHFVTSAKTADGVQQVFDHLVSKLPLTAAPSSGSANGGGAAAGGRAGSGVSLERQPQQQQQSDCGC